MIKARLHDPFLRIRVLLVPKIGSCEHIEDDLPAHGSVSLKKWIEIEHALFSFDTLFERWKAPTNFAWYPCDRFGTKLKILCQFWKLDSVNILQMTFRHPYHKNWTLKSDRLNASFQFSKPRNGSLKSDRVNGPLNLMWMLSNTNIFGYLHEIPDFVWLTSRWSLEQRGYLSNNSYIMALIQVSWFAVWKRGSGV